MQVFIPGEPCAQGRPRFARIGRYVRTFDPGKSHGWKATARLFMQQAMAGFQLLEGPLECRVTAVFTCPKREASRAEAQERRSHAKRPDAENVAKAVLDAATGIVWRDDAQVALLTIRKVIGRAGEAPGVTVIVGCAG